MKARAWAALIAVYIVWGSTYLAILFANETISPFLMAGIRFLVLGACIPNSSSQEDRLLVFREVKKRTFSIPQFCLQS